MRLFKTQVKSAYDGFDELFKEDIKHLVYEDEKNFIVFIDQEYDIDWRTSEEYDLKNNDAESKSKRANFINEMQFLEIQVLPCWPKNIQMAMKRIIAQMGARALSGNFEQAIQAKEYSEKVLEEKKKDVSRYWILIVSLFMGGLFALIALSIKFNKDSIVNIYGENGYHVLFSFGIGGVGALFSILLRLGKINISDGGSSFLHYLEGTSRILAGGLSAILVTCFVLVGLLKPTIIPEKFLGIEIFIMAFIAGASERLAPSIISSVESKSKINNRKKK